MSDLGTLGGDSAIAYDVDDKGDVVVGISSTGSSGSHAFRWTSAGMTDLGSFGGDSQANAVNGSGSTVVGWSDDLHSVKRAFLWTAGTGMLNLGVLPGGDVSIANGVSEDGSVVVGWSNSAGTSARAVRWAGPQGIQDLNLLLSQAGVDMTGITLMVANGVSADGAFIVGFGDFSGANHGFLVRYERGQPKKNGKPIAGMTTAGSLQDSINGLGEARQQSLIEQQAFADPLTEPTAQLTLDEGFSLLVDAAFAESDRQEGLVDDGNRAGLAVRYFPTEDASANH
jgi:probable HAF family extracellular repeat protein